MVETYLQDETLQHLIRRQASRMLTLVWIAASRRSGSLGLENGGAPNPTVPLSLRRRLSS